MTSKPPRQSPFQRIQRLSASSAVRFWGPWLGGALVIAVLAALWLPLSHIEITPEAMRAWQEKLGPLAPLAFFLLNVVQIIVAPLPGYPVQILGGYLFDFVSGVIYTVGGMVVGGTLAAWLTRRLGRPWLERRLGAETLAHWGDIAHINSFWAWCLILLIPIGDLTYFLAGLTKVRLRTFALAILTSRGPFTAFLVWTGSSVVDLPLWWLVALIGVISLVIIIGFSQRARVEAWARVLVAHLARRDQATPIRGQVRQEGEEG